MDRSNQYFKDSSKQGNSLVASEIRTNDNALLSRDQTFCITRMMSMITRQNGVKYCFEGLGRFTLES